MLKINRQSESFAAYRHPERGVLPDTIDAAVSNAYRAYWQNQICGSSRPSDRTSGTGYGQRISQTVSGKSQRQFPLPWSHYVRLLAIDDPRKRDFYEKEAQKGGWSVRQLDRQINAMLYERLALSKQKEKSSLKADQRAATVTPEQEIKSIIANFGAVWLST